MDAPIHCTALEMKTMTVDVARPPVNEDMEKAARSPRNTSFLLKRSDALPSRSRELPKVKA